MDASLIETIIFALSISVVFNLFLTIRLVAIVGSGKIPPPFSVVIGEPLPTFEGKMFVDGRLMTSVEWLGQAAVLVFLSASCPKCMSRLPELCEINRAMQRAGVPLWMIGVDSTRRVARHLRGSELLQNFLVLDPSTRRGLNPNHAAPFYIFVDHQGIAQDRGFIGDENWQLFVEQLHRDKTPTEAAA
jgi:hypothetical protein